MIIRASLGVITSSSVFFQAPHLQPAVESHIQQLSTDFQAFEARLRDGAMEVLLVFPIACSCYARKMSVQVTFDDLTRPLETMSAPLTQSWRLVEHLMSVNNSDDVRTAHSSLQPAVTVTLQTIAQSQVLPHIHLFGYPLLSTRLTCLYHRLEHYTEQRQCGSLSISQSRMHLNHVLCAQH